MNPTIEELTAAVERDARKRPEATRLMTHPGVGPLTALASVLIIGTPYRDSSVTEKMVAGSTETMKRHRTERVGRTRECQRSNQELDIAKAGEGLLPKRSRLWMPPHPGQVVPSSFGDGHASVCTNLAR